MLNELKKRQRSGDTIKVGLIGAGAMGIGIAWQIARTPGMELSFVADINPAAAEKAQTVYGKKVALFTDPLQALEDEKISFDVLVEASNTIGPAAKYCIQAISRKAHVILMNAEVDLVLGPYLQYLAKQNGVVVTSDAGDQHGVLMRMIDEIEMWGFDIVQAGNIKGFLDRYATSITKQEIAKQLNLNLIQCVAYTDGTKLNIEMALIANAANLQPFVPGMEGPKAKEVTQALDLFNFDAYQGIGRVDYLLGSEPGGGVYVVGKCEDKTQAEYLKYYKVHSRYPYYLFYRPYHLCHLETPRAIALAALWNKPVLTPAYGMVTDVYTYAKQPLNPGNEIQHSIGGDEMYGLIHSTNEVKSKNYLPIGVLEAEKGIPAPRVKHSLAKDQPVTWSDVELSETYLLKLYKKQNELLQADVKLTAEV